MPRPSNEELNEKSQLSQQGLKRCRNCREILPLGSFGSQSRSSDGHQPWCKPCTNKRMNGYDKSSRERDPEGYADRKRAEHARFKVNNPEKHRSHVRKNNLRKYGLTPEDFDALLEKQAGLCVICKEELSPGRGRHVDHDHGTGAVRGILCNGCNVGLGYFRDSPEILKSAANYVEQARVV